MFDNRTPFWTKNQLDQHDFLFEIYRHQVTHYTGQLAKDTSKHLKDLSSISTGSVDGIASQSEQRQWRLQRERLQDDFTTALNKFQAAQRLAAQKEKEVIKKTRHTGTVNCFCSYFRNVEWAFFNLIENRKFQCN